MSMRSKVEKAPRASVGHHLMLVLYVTGAGGMFSRLFCTVSLTNSSITNCSASGANNTVCTLFSAKKSSAILAASSREVYDLL
eukprot:4902405-Pleurochrysis_carterae.AAC.1